MLSAAPLAHPVTAIVGGFGVVLDSEPSVLNVISTEPAVVPVVTDGSVTDVGLPNVALQVFAAVYEAGRGATAAGYGSLGTAFYVLLGVGAVNTALSAYYYRKVVRAILLDEPECPLVATATLAPPPASHLLFLTI